MGEPKTMHSVRSLRGMPPAMGLRSETSRMLQLHRLALERMRLVREMELSRKRQATIELRLQEVAAQIAGLERLISRPVRAGIEPAPPAEGRRRQLTVEY